MRWPLRIQILVPMLGVTLLAIIGVSLFNAYLSAQRTQERIEHDLAEVSDTLANSGFRITDAVLRQMRGLSGADYVLTDKSGEVILNSSSPGEFPALPPRSTIPASGASALGEPIQIGDRSYFYTNVELRRANERSLEPRTLHIYYPQESYEEAWRDVVQPPLIVAALTMLLVVGLSLGIASRLTRPLVRLQGQVGEIAAGKFRSMPIPDRNDEVADLSRAVNRMAETLAQYEQQVRRHEQLRTLGQLGGGIAHQLRNAVTGCKMAIELHARTCESRGDEESLAVAQRQMTLMENYLQRFLALGKHSPVTPKQLDLRTVIESAVGLIQPTAKHLGVNLQTKLPPGPVTVLGDAGSLEQALINILLNGVEAASEAQERQTHSGQAAVRVSLRDEQGRAKLTVSDTGPGPIAAIQETLFEPFVSEKADGVGLGLSVARETIQAHGGTIDWTRQDESTCFQIAIPLAADDAPIAEQFGSNEDLAQEHDSKDRNSVTPEH